MIKSMTKSDKGWAILLAIIITCHIINDWIL